ncbi:MAG: PAS domain S-box protein [Candidatus Thorarchaeota archaeon]
MPNVNSNETGLLVYMNTPAILVDKNHVIHGASPPLLALLGVPLEEINGKKCWDVFHEEKTAPDYCPFTSVLSHHKRAVVNIDVPFLDTDQIVIHFPLKIAGNPEEFVIIAFDVDTDLDSSLVSPAPGRIREMLFDTISVPLLILDSDLRIIIANSSFYETFELVKNNTIGMRFDELEEGCFKTTELQSLMEQISRGDSILEKIESTIKFPVIGIRDLAFTSRQFQLGNENNIFTVIEIHDITEKKEIERELQKRGPSYQLLVEEAFEGIAIMQNGRYVYINESFASQIGCSRQEALELSNEEIWARVHPDDVPILRARNGELNQGLFKLPSLRFRYLHPDGTVCWVDSFVKKIKLAGKPANLLYQNDITDYVHTIRELEQSESRLRAIFETTPIAIVIFDLSGHIVEITRAGIELAGIDSPEELRNFNLLEAPDLPKEIKRKVKEGKTVIFDLTLDFNRLVQANIYPTKRRDTAYLKVGIAPLRMGEEGHIEGYIVQIVDITRQMLAEKRAVTAAELAFVTSDIMAHDLRNFLQRIELAGELLKRQSMTKEQANSIEMLLDSVESAQQIISDMAMTQNLISTPMVVESLQKALDNALQQLSTRYQDANIEVEYRTLNPIVMADEHLERLFSTIIENAIVHNDKDRKQVWVTIKEEDSYYCVTIEDNGPGIPRAIKESILDPKKRSAGVGLIQAQLIAKKYGGSLSIQDRIPNTQGSGAKVQILIPKYVTPPL